MQGSFCTWRKAIALGEVLVLVIVVVAIALFSIPYVVRTLQMDSQQKTVMFLRSLERSQRLFRELALIDADGNGTGRYAFFQELAEAAETLKVAPTDLKGKYMKPSGVMVRYGYCFRLYLPLADVPQRPEDFASEAKGSVPRISPENEKPAETQWLCYAWPLARSTHLNRTFCARGDGSVYYVGGDSNGGPAYVGELTGPAPETLSQGYGNMREHTGHAETLVGTDGRTWVLLR